MNDEYFATLAGVFDACGAELAEPAKAHPSGWSFGDRARVLADDAAETMWFGDEGTLIPQQDGSLMIVRDGTNAPVLVDPAKIEKAPLPPLPQVA